MTYSDQIHALASELYAKGITLDEAKRSVRKAFIEGALRETKGNQCLAAIRLGMHRNTLCREIKELGIEVRRESSRKPPRSVKPVAEKPRKVVGYTPLPKVDPYKQAQIWRELYPGVEV